MHVKLGRFVEPMENDKLIQTTLAHEFWRCTQAFHEFAYLIAILPDNSTKLQRLECYNAYVDFLSHLYEFYVGLMKTDNRYKVDANKGGTHIDAIFNAEVAKLFRNRKNRLLHGYKDSMGHRIDFYDCEIPLEFGKHFRFIRHRRNHADPKRAGDVSLKDFYEKYHKFIIILHEECRWLWQVDENEFDWIEIENFANEVVKSLPPHKKQNPTPQSRTLNLRRAINTLLSPKKK